MESLRLLNACLKDKLLAFFSKLATLRLPISNIHPWTIASVSDRESSSFVKFNRGANMS